MLEGVLRLGYAGRYGVYGKRIDYKSLWSDKTGFPAYEDMVKNPDYFLKEKGRKLEVKMMTPDEYIREAAKVLTARDGTLTTYADLIRQRGMSPYGNKNVQDLQEKLFKGVKLDMPHLDYDWNGQEGIHRAIAAKWLGLEKIPVTVVNRVQNEAPKQ